MGLIILKPEYVTLETNEIASFRNISRSADESSVNLANVGSVWKSSLYVVPTVQPCCSLRIFSLMKALCKNMN